MPTGANTPHRAREHRMEHRRSSWDSSGSSFCVSRFPTSAWTGYVSASCPAAQPSPALPPLRALGTEQFHLTVDAHSGPLCIRTTTIHSSVAGEGFRVSERLSCAEVRTVHRFMGFRLGLGHKSFTSEGGPRCLPTTRLSLLIYCFLLLAIETL